MVSSMTGFGRGEWSDGKHTILAEIKSVNHRYSDITVKMPRRYSFVEEDIRKAVKETAPRGKVEVGITIEAGAEDDLDIELNDVLAGKYIGKLEELQQKFDLKGEADLQFIASFPDVLRAVPDVEAEEEVKAAILNAVKVAAEAHLSMRDKEGERMAADLIHRGDLILGLVASIEERVPEMREEYKEKLRQRIAELTDGMVDVPEDRILLEAAIFADKASITEEIVRLKSHVAQLKEILEKAEGPVGKKLDFLVQEMNREANTIGSKANDLDITSFMLDIKSEVEKIREQVQNIL